MLHGRSWHVGEKILQRVRVELLDAEGTVLEISKVALRRSKRLAEYRAGPSG